MARIDQLPDTEWELNPEPVVIPEVVPQEQPVRVPVEEPALVPVER